MKKRIFSIILLLAFLFQPGLHRLNSESVKAKKAQKAFQYEVVVALKLVQVHVTDKDGNPVTDLTKDDFILYDNKKLQTITDFEKHLQAIPEKPIEPEKKVIEIIDETKLPPSPDVSSRMNRKFVLFFAARGLSKSEKASLHFIDTQIQPTDEVAVMSYSWVSGLELHEYFTSDMDKVKEAIKNISGLKGSGIRDPRGITLEGERARAESEAGSRGGTENREEDRVSVTFLSPVTRRFPYPDLFAIRPTIEEELKIFLAKTFVDGLRELAQSMRSIPGIKNIIFFSDGIPRSFLFPVIKYSGKTMRKWAENLPQPTALCTQSV